MKTKFSLSLLALIICEGIWGQSMSSQTLASYIPKDYSILDSAQGDLNGDGYKDWVLILKSKYEEFNTDTTRPLLLLLGTKRGVYTLFAKNDSVVLCKGCGGVFGDPYEGITVKKGYFEIHHYGGSNWRWTRNISFKYNSITKGFLLHRDSGISYHTSDPNKSKTTIINKKDFDKLPFSKYSYEKSQ